MLLSYFFNFLPDEILVSTSCADGFFCLFEIGELAIESLSTDSESESSSIVNNYSTTQSLLVIYNDDTNVWWYKKIIIIILN